MAGYLFAFLAVIQMSAFFTYYQTTASVKIKWIVYLVYQVRNTAEALVPLIAAAATLLLWRAGQKKFLLFPVLPVLSRALYFLPDHYLYYLADDLSSGEAIAMAAIVTFLECAAIYGFVLLLFLIAKRILGKTEVEEGEETAGFFCIEIPFIKAVFSISFVYFFLQTIVEIIETADYLITNAGTYTLEEIATILASFLFHLAILFATHVISLLYIRYARKHYRIEEQASLCDTPTEGDASQSDI